MVHVDTGVALARKGLELDLERERFVGATHREEERPIAAAGTHGGAEEVRLGEGDCVGGKNQIARAEACPPCRPIVGHLCDRSEGASTNERTETQAEVSAPRQGRQLIHCRTMIRRAGRCETIHVCLPDDVDAVAMASVLEATGRAVIVLAQEELGLRLGEIDVLFCGAVPAIDWSSAGSLRLVQMLGSGVDSLWPADGLPREVQVANARGLHVAEIRDHALALMLSFERELPRLAAQQMKRQFEPFPTGSVTGKTLSILGVGEIGRGLAKAARALGMRVVGTRMHPEPCADIDETLGPDDAARALEVADYAVVLLPLTSRTRGSIDRAMLARLRAHAVLLVLSRGGIVDEMALEEALRSGRLRGGALDVFAVEPLPSSSTLWTTPNLVITPHQAGWMPDLVPRILALAIENIERVERGEPPRTAIDRQHRY